MTNFKYPLICFLALVNLFPFSGHAQTVKNKVVFIIADGIPADVLEKVKTPHLDEISKSGVYKRAYVGGELNTYSQTPTISAPGYMDLITGTWGNKHNVWDNNLAAPNYHYKNIFRLLKEQHPQQTTAIFSTWLDNRTKLVGEGLEKAGSFHFDYKFDGYELDTQNFPHQGDSKHIHQIDEMVINKAADGIRNNAPDLSWIYLQYTDDMGHHHGDSEMFYAAIQKADEQIGRIWEAINYREQNFKEDWMIVITTDHGRDAATGKNHGGQSDRERTTWIVSNKKFDNAYFQKYNPAVVDLLPTMARHLKLKIPQESFNELDGVPLSGPVALAKPQAKLEGNNLIIKWQPLKTSGKVRVSVAMSNAYQTGGKDVYQKLGNFSLKNGEARIILKQLSPENFYKVLLETEENVVNTWITK